MSRIAHFVTSWQADARHGGRALNVSLGDRWEEFVDRIVKTGRYSSASEVVREGLRLVEEREAKLAALRATLDASVAAGGEVTERDIDAALERKARDLAAEGF
jgi:antitoxin ParD1/3/4